MAGNGRDHHPGRRQVTLAAAALTVLAAVGDLGAAPPDQPLPPAGPSDEGR